MEPTINRYRPRDSQRSAVYRWERSMSEWPGQSLSLDDCKELIAKVCTTYHIHIPTVRDGRGTRVARGGAWIINLPRWARTDIVVLHECAHSIICCLHIPGASHGKVFATLFLLLLKRFSNVDTVRARKLGITQRPRRVHFASITLINALLEGNKQ